METKTTINIILLIIYFILTLVWVAMKIHSYFYYKSILKRQEALELRLSVAIAERTQERHVDQWVFKNYPTVHKHAMDELKKIMPVPPSVEFETKLDGKS